MEKIEKAHGANVRAAYFGLALCDPHLSYTQFVFELFKDFLPFPVARFHHNIFS